jgi:dihydrodipicolinate synthase/N-acetylneuraminate lyase
MFGDGELELDLPAIRRHVQFLRDGGIDEGTGVLLAGGAAGDFSTMTFAERLQVAETVIEAADGKIPVAMGAQTTSTRELVELARAAERLGADYIQVSPPFYFGHTEQDFFEFVTAAAEATDVGIIVYNTYWTSTGVSTNMVERLVEIPNMIGLKWATDDTGRMTFEHVVSHFSDRLSIIDNQNRFLTSHILGARCIELHICNHWPQFGVRLWQLLEEQKYVEAQQEMIRVILPFMQLWAEMEQHTNGDGYLDKLCMELVGLDSSRCRPPTRDVRDKFREKARQMLMQCETPGVVESLCENLPE